MTKAFISYHHENDQDYKHHLTLLARHYGAFEDRSLPVTGIQDDHRSSESIRRQIRDHFLRDTQVTILLCGHETKGRKYVDWELKSSMIDGPINRKSGILVINLPGVASGWTAALPEEKSMVYPDYGGGWTTFSRRSDYEAKYPLMPARIVDNLLNPDAKISVVPWERVADDPRTLRWLVDASAAAGRTNSYDLSRAMRRNDSARVGPGLAELFAPPPSNALGRALEPKGYTPPPRRNALAEALWGVEPTPENTLAEALQRKHRR